MNVNMDFILENPSFYHICDICKTIRMNKKTSILRLRNQDLNENDTDCVIDAIIDNPVITILDLSQNTSFYDELYTKIPTILNLREINLSHSTIYDRNLEILINGIIKHPTLSVLKLSSMNITHIKEEYTTLVEQCANLIKLNKKIRYLELMNNNIINIDKILRILRCNCRILDIKLDNNQISKRDIKRIKNCLDRNRMMENGPPIFEKIYIKIPDLLPKSYYINVEHILNNPNMYDTEMITKAIKKNNCITDLNLDRCNINDSDILKIIESLNKKPSIIIFNISQNKIFKSDTFKSLSSITGVMSINLSNIKICEYNLKLLVDGFIDNEDISNINLKNIVDINNSRNSNYISEEIARLIAFNGSISDINIINNNISDVDPILNILFFNKNINEINIERNPISKIQKSNLENLLNRNNEFIWKENISYSEIEDLYL